MARVLSEPGGLVRPGFADSFVGREAAWRLVAAGEVVGGHEVREVLPELIVAVVVEAFDGGVFDRVVHPLNLTIIRYVPSRCPASQMGAP